MTKIISMLSLIFLVVLTGCGGGGSGGGSTAEGFSPQRNDPPVVVTMTPQTVMKSSYTNEIYAMEKIGPQVLPKLPFYNANQAEVITAGYAYADFFRDGNFSLVTFSNVFNNDQSFSRTAGKIRFFSKVNGAWVDKTSLLLADQTGCISPRKVIIADFNADGLPDVFAACHGIDEFPFSGEAPKILMSHAGGKYTNTALPFNCFCHAASAADVRNDGYSDIVVTDTSVALTPFFLKNNKDGSFTQDFTRLPASLHAQEIYTVELMDINADTKYDLFLGGNRISEVLMNAGTPGGSEIYPTIITMPPSSVANPIPLDVAYWDGSLYVMAVNALTYSDVVVQKISLSDYSSTTIYSHSGSFGKGADDSPWFPWMSLNRLNDSTALISQDARFPVSIALFN